MSFNINDISLKLKKVSKLNNQNNINLNEKTFLVTGNDYQQKYKYIQDKLSYIKINESDLINYDPNNFIFLNSTLINNTENITAADMTTRGDAIKANQLNRGGVMIIDFTKSQLLYYYGITNNYSTSVNYIYGQKTINFILNDEDSFSLRAANKYISNVILDFNLSNPNITLLHKSPIYYDNFKEYIYVFQYGNGLIIYDPVVSGLFQKMSQHYYKLTLYYPVYEIISRRYNIKIKNSRVDTFNKKYIYTTRNSTNDDFEFDIRNINEFKTNIEKNNLLKIHNIYAKLDQTTINELNLDVSKLKYVSDFTGQFMQPIKTGTYEYGLNDIKNLLNNNTNFGIFIRESKIKYEVSPTYKIYKKSSGYINTIPRIYIINNDELTIIDTTDELKSIQFTNNEYFLTYNVIYSDNNYKYAIDTKLKSVDIIEDITNQENIDLLSSETNPIVINIYENSLDKTSINYVYNGKISLDLVNIQLYTNININLEYKYSLKIYITKNFILLEGPDEIEVFNKNDIIYSLEEKYMIFNNAIPEYISTNKEINSTYIPYVYSILNSEKFIFT